jgi:hypothetical protein
MPVTAVLAGLVVDLREGWIAAAVFVGPFIAAGWTSPRGSDDGLWVLVFPSMVVVFIIGAGLIVVARRVLRDPQRRFRRSTNRPWLLPALAIMAALASILLMFERRADPFPGLERAAASYAPPPGLYEAEYTGRATPWPRAATVRHSKPDMSARQRVTPRATTQKRPSGRGEPQVGRPSHPMTSMRVAGSSRAATSGGPSGSNMVHTRRRRRCSRSGDIRE